MSLVSPSLRSVLPPLHPSSNSSIKYFFSECQNSLGSKVVYTLYTLMNLLLLPLFSLVLFMGLQQWRRRPSSPSGATSHSDFFTFQMMMVDVCGVLGSGLYTFGTHFKSEAAVLTGMFFFSFVLPVQTLIHVLTCVERHLAVVHAIPYIHVREKVKVRIRNLSTGAVWLVGFVWVGVARVSLPDFPIVPFLPFLAACLLVTSHCCLSVLCFLTRPGPGGVSRRVDPSKRRAFNMILAITVTLMVRIIGLLVAFGVDNLISLDAGDECVMMDAGICLTVPSSLVLPLLFLHRAGRLPSCRKTQRD